MPTITDILVDTNLFNAHLTDIDKSLNSFPSISQPIASHKDNLDLGVPPLNEIPDFPPPTETRSFPSPQINANCHIVTSTNPSDTRSFASPQTNANCHTVTSTNSLITTHGTWKRLEHAKHVMDISDTTLSTIRPKRKVETLHGMHGMSLDKKHKLNEETTITD